MKATVPEIMSKGGRPGYDTAKESREERLASALRANLARRKQQAREKARAQAPADAPPSDEERRVPGE